MPRCLQLPHVLLADDSKSDAELTERAFTEAGMSAIFTHVTDGEQAIERCRTALDGHYPFPDLIILDMVMPRAGGEEVLRFLQGDERLAQIPVVLFTGAPEKSEWRELKANAWAVKPDSFKELIEQVRDWSCLLPDATPPHGSDRHPEEQ